MGGSISFVWCVGEVKSKFVKRLFAELCCAVSFISFFWQIPLGKVGSGGDGRLTIPEEEGPRCDLLWVHELMILYHHGIYLRLPYHSRDPDP